MRRIVNKKTKMKKKSKSQNVSDLDLFLKNELASPNLIYNAVQNPKYYIEQLNKSIELGLVLSDEETKKRDSLLLLLNNKDDSEVSDFVVF